jgi:hypothetical protein
MSDRIAQEAAASQQLGKRGVKESTERIDSERNGENEDNK